MLYIFCVFMHERKIFAEKTTLKLFSEKSSCELKQVSNSNAWTIIYV